MTWECDAKGDVNVWQLPSGALCMRFRELVTCKLITVSGNLLQVLTSLDKQLTLLRKKQKTKDYHLKPQLKTRKICGLSKSLIGCHQSSVLITKIQEEGTLTNGSPALDLSTQQDGARPGPLPSPHLEFTDASGNPSHTFGRKAPSTVYTSAPITAHTTVTFTARACSRSILAATKRQGNPSAGVEWFHREEKNTSQEGPKLLHKYTPDISTARNLFATRADLGLHTFKLGIKGPGSNPA